MQSKVKTAVAVVIFLTSFCVLASAQTIESVLLQQMQAYEIDIQNTYREYQKLYYEKKSSRTELLAFEDIISVYVSQILEIYETLVLAGLGGQELSRDIAARALIFRALTFLEKAPLNVEYYEKACYDYYRALELYRDVDEMPVIFKRLPQDLWIGNKRYTRLIDLLDEKGQDLCAFGRVELNFRNFKITSDLDTQPMKFVRFELTPVVEKYTYYTAKERLGNVFEEVLRKNGNVSFYLALPEGSYYIRPRSGLSPRYLYLATIYVRANQQQDYVVEPMADWVIFYENPKSKRPDFYKYRQQKAYQDVAGGNSGDSEGDDSPQTRARSKNFGRTKEQPVNLVSQIVKDYLEEVEAKLTFDLKDPWFRNRFVDIVSEIITKNVLSPQFHNSWSMWALAWEIAKQIVDALKPGSQVPSELIQLVYNVINEL